MKKLITAVAVLACAASIVSAQTVTSANIVGYTKVVVVGGELSLVAINFETGGAMVSELCDGLGVGSAVYVWDKVTGAYLPVSKGPRGWSGDISVELGAAMWISASGTESIELIFSGEVLTEDVVVSVPAGVEMSGYSYPVEIELKTTAIGDALPAGSAFYIWDEAGQTYTSASKGPRGWSGSAIVGPKTGYWVSNDGAALEVVVPVPFTP